MKNKVLDIFQKYDFYDFVVSKFNYDFAQQVVDIHFLICDDITDEYVPMQLIFSGVRSFVSQYDKNFNLIVSGCYSANCLQISKNFYEATFILQLREGGRDVPAWEIKIGFTDVKLVGGLSKKSLKYKYQTVE